MPGFSLRNMGYITDGGQTVRLAPRSGDLPALEFKADTEGTISTVRVSAVGGNSEGYNLAAARWYVSPDPVMYAKTKRLGPVCVYRAGGPSTKLTAYVPTEDGEKQFSVTVDHGGVSNVQDLFKKTVTRGDETLKVETSFWFGTAKSQVPTRLVRTMSPGVPSERTIIVDKKIDYPANTGVTLSEPITFPASVAKGSTGVGYEYMWEADPAVGQTVRSHALPIWVLGDDPSCKAPTLASVPASSSLTYPAIFTRPASQTPKITPASGKTYQQYVDRWVAVSKTTGIQGPNLSIEQYFAKIYFIDLDDTSIPKYTLKHWDIQGWGYDLAGWYGTDSTNQPTRTKVAVDVPIPNYATPSIGTDRSMAIVGMRGGKIETTWELWCALKRGDGSWEAASVGKTNATDQWRHTTNYTVASAGLSALGYALRVCEAKDAVDYIRAERAAGRVPSEDVIAQKIPHRLSLNLPNPGTGISWPATHTDGTDGDVTTPWEGQHIYLDQSFDVAAQNYPPLTHAIAVIGKKFGWFVTDRTNYSTTMIVEGDETYGTKRAIWDTITTPGEKWDFLIPADKWVIGTRYPDKAAWDKDTVNPSDGGTGQSGSTTPAVPPATANLSGLPFKLGFFGHDPARLKRAESVIGRAADFAQMSPQRSTSGWQKPAGSPPETPNGVFDSTWWLTSHGSEKSLELSMPLWHADAGETLANAASGAYDAQWERFGKLVHDARPGSVIRIGWEMNLAGWGWAPKAGQEALWRDAFRRASAAAKKGGPSLLVSFVPNIGVGDTGVRPDAVYPGDAYVDLVGFDAYDWWPPYTSDSAWAQHRDADMSWAWWFDFAKTHGKKVVIPEIGLSNGVGNTNDGDDNPLFFRYVMPWLLARKDQLWGLSYFDEPEDYIRNSIGDNQVPLGAAEFKKQLATFAA